MTRQAAAFFAAALIGLGGAGVTVASAWNDVPQDAVPVPVQTPPAQDPAQPGAVEEAPPEGTPAPSQPIPVPVPLITPGEGIETTDTGVADPDEEAASEPVAKAAETGTPGRRTRMRVAVVEALDKVTAERMRFEVPVGGRPVRFKGTLIFTAKACERSAPDEQVRDFVAYMDVSVQPRGVLQAAEPRQIFQGWMFASTPAVSGLQNAVYDAWVVGCRA